MPVVVFAKLIKGTWVLENGVGAGAPVEGVVVGPTAPVSDDVVPSDPPPGLAAT